MKIPYNCSHFKNSLLCHVKLFISEYYSNIPFYLHVCVYLQSRYFLFSKIVFLASTGYSLRGKKMMCSPKLLKMNLNRKKLYCKHQ